MSSRGKKHQLEAHQHPVEHQLVEDAHGAAEEKTLTPRAKKMKLTEEQKDFVRRLYAYNREEYYRTLRKEKINFRNYVARTARQLGITKGAVQRACAGELDPLTRPKRGGPRGKCKLDVTDEPLARKIRRYIRIRTRKQLPTTIKDITEYVNGNDTQAEGEISDEEGLEEDQLPLTDLEGQKYSVSNETVRRYLVKLGIKFQRGKGVIVNSA